METRTPEKVREIVQLWNTCDSLMPMPISRTRDRICGWIYDLKQAGLITEEEAQTLRDSDQGDREAFQRDTERDLGWR